MDINDINIKLRALTTMYADLTIKIEGIRESIIELDRKMNLIYTRAWGMADADNKLSALHDPMSSLRNRD